MSDRIGIFGASGSGKTSVLYHELKRSPLDRIVMFDPVGEALDWRGFKAAWNKRDVAQIVRKTPVKYKIAMQAKAGEEAATLNMICATLLTMQAGYKQHGKKLLLAVDELNLAFPVHGGETKCPAFAEICSRGRHFGIEVIGVSQRVAEVSQRFRGNLSGVVVLRQMGKANVDAAADLVGSDPATVRGLPNYHGLAYQSGAAKAEPIGTRKIPAKP